MIRRTNLALGLSVAALVVAACGGGGATSAPTAGAPTGAAATPAPTTAESMAPATPAATAATGGATIVAQEVGDAGTIIIDGETGLTLYYFEMDVRDSGESVCTGDCLAAWPALTVEPGETPTGGPGVTGEIGTITRADNGEIQVTYNGLPLYFFQGDSEPGDLNGVYDQWILVEP